MMGVMFWFCEAMTGGARRETRLATRDLRGVFFVFFWEDNLRWHFMDRGIQLVRHATCDMRGYLILVC